MLWCKKKKLIWFDVDVDIHYIVISKLIKMDNSKYLIGYL